LIKFQAQLKITPGKGLDISANRKLFIHQAMDSVILKDVEQFVPMHTGTLTRSVYAMSSVGTLVWSTPYARYQYYGMSRPKKGELVGRPLNYRKTPHPKAGEKWIERTKPVWMKNWLRVFFALLKGNNQTP
jgi:hypothetical protein